MNDKIRDVAEQIELSEGENRRLIARLTGALDRRKEVVFSYLHGSFIEQGRFRDIDVAVYLNDRATEGTDILSYEVKLASELEDALAALDLARRLSVDVRVLNAAPLGFLYHVTRGAVLTSRDEDFGSDFIERVWTSYFDFAPAAKEFLRDLIPSFHL